MNDYPRGSYVRFKSKKTQGVAKILDENTAQYIEVDNVNGFNMDGIAVPLAELIITGRADSIKYGRIDSILLHRWDKMPIFHATMSERDIERMNAKCLKDFIKGVLNYNVYVKEFADRVYQVNTQYDTVYINEETMNTLADFSPEFIQCYLSHNNPDDKVFFKLHNARAATKFVESVYGI